MSGRRKYYEAQQFNFVLPTTPRPYSSGVVVHMGSAKGACSLESDSARASIVFTSGLLLEGDQYRLQIEKLSLSVSDG